MSVGLGHKFSFNWFGLLVAVVVSLYDKDEESRCNDCPINAQVPLNILHHQPPFKPHQGKDTLHVMYS